MSNASGRSEGLRTSWLFLKRKTYRHHCLHNVFLSFSTMSYKLFLFMLQITQRPKMHCRFFVFFIILEQQQSRIWQRTTYIQVQAQFLTVLFILAAFSILAASVSKRLPKGPQHSQTHKMGMVQINLKLQIATRKHATFRHCSYKHVASCEP